MRFRLGMVHATPCRRHRLQHLLHGTDELVLLARPKVEPKYIQYCVFTTTFGQHAPATTVQMYGSGASTRRPAFVC